MDMLNPADCPALLADAPTRLRTLADWFDWHDRRRLAVPDDQVQADLRVWADAIEALL